MRGRTLGAGVVALATLLTGLPPAAAVSADLTVVVSDDPADHTPHLLDGQVLAVAEVGDYVVVGGTFTRARNAGRSEELVRRRLLVYTAQTGRIAEWVRPRFNGTVETVVADPSGTAVIVGGSFTKVNGKTHRRLVKIDLIKGRLVRSFEGRTNGTVHKGVVRGNRLIIGGRFTAVNGTARQRLAMLNATTGRLVRWLDVPVRVTRAAQFNRNPFVFELDATPDGSQLVIVGNFKRVGGRPREQVAVVDLVAGKVTPWSSRWMEPICARTSFFVADVEIDPTGSWFALAARGGYLRGGLCDTASRWELTPDDTTANPTWVNYTGGDTLWSVAVTSAAVYVGGHQRWMDNPYCNNCEGPGAVSRPGIAALDPGNGKALDWNPGRSRGVGAQELVATNRGLYVGSDTTLLGGEYHGRFGLFPAVGPYP